MDLGGGGRWLMGPWRGLHGEGTFWSVVELRRMGWAGHVARIVAICIAYVFVWSGVQPADSWVGLTVAEKQTWTV